MSTSLVQIVGQIFSAPVVGRIAQTFGINPTLAQTLANAAVPAVLAALANLASSRDGARKIAEQVQNQDSNILGGLVNAASGQNSAGFATSGAGMLSSLGINVDALAEPIARTTGAPTQAATQMLGLATPAVFGALAQQDPQIWSSGDGIAGLFEREKGAIASAMPAGLGSALGATGVLGTLAGLGGATAAPTATPMHEPRVADARVTSTPAERAAMPPPAAASQTSGGIPSWLKFALPLVVLAGLVWAFMPTQQVSQPAPAPVPQSTAPTPQATQAATELAAFAQRTNATVGSITTALAGITNSEQARAAQSRLDTLAGELSTAADSFMRLPDAARGPLAAPMQGMVGTLREQLSRVGNIPGAEAIKPTLDRLTAAADRFKA